VVDVDAHPGAALVAADVQERAISDWPMLTSTIQLRCPARSAKGSKPARELLRGSPGISVSDIRSRTVLRIRGDLHPGAAGPKPRSSAGARRRNSPVRIILREVRWCFSSGCSQRR
jgi:hypothetical protein